jgi:putative endonuclease
MKLPAWLSRRARGDAAEKLAEQFLRKQGLKLVDRNFRVRKGEIDLIMTDADTLVFVEVRMRTHAGFGGGAASIGPAKQRRLIAAAHHYLGTLKPTPPCRFDAVLLNQLDESRIEWIRNAFDA